MTCGVANAVLLASIISFQNGYLLKVGIIRANLGYAGAPRTTSQLVRQVV